MLGALGGALLLHAAAGVGLLGLGSEPPSPELLAAFHLVSLSKPPAEDLPAQPVAMAETEAVPMRPEPEAQTHPAPAPRPQPRRSVAVHVPVHRPVLKSAGSRESFSDPASEPEPLSGRPADGPAQGAPVKPVELDQTAVARAYRANPKPRYPLLARRRGWQGRVLLRVEVGAHGRVDALAVERGSGFDILDQAAVQAVQAWRFTPARRSGQGVPAIAQVLIRFQLKS